MADPKRFDLLGVGVAVRDITLRLDPFPERDSKVPAREMKESGGGPVPTALVTVARLGGRAAWAGPLADDPAARFIEESMDGEGIDLRGAVRRRDSLSPTSVILVEADGSRRVCEWRQEELPFAPEDLAPVHELMGSTRALLVDGRYPDAQEEAARRVHASGGLVAMDCGHPRPGADRLLPHCDIAILSHSYARAERGATTDTRRYVSELAERLRGDGPRIAGLTLGEEGCLLSEKGGEPVHVAPLEIEPRRIVDTTGAGDVFHGAFLFEWVRNPLMVEAARFAGAAATLSCLGLTGRAPLPPLEKIRQAAATGR